MVTSLIVDMSVYIYTIPKSGTYFFAAMLELLGLENTGIHIMKEHYLDTKRFDLNVNSKYPSRTLVKQDYRKTIRSLSENQIAFGHYPLPMIPFSSQRHTKFLCAYRHPRETLVSEYIDFRFRRKDIPWISPEKIPNHKKAFIRFMRRHGVTHHYDSIKYFVYTAQYLHSPIGYRKRRKTQFYNFDKTLIDPQESNKISKFIGKPIEINRAAAFLEALKSTETKTKVNDIKIDRQSLWTAKAEELYHERGFDRLITKARNVGLEF